MKRQARTPRCYTNQPLQADTEITLDKRSSHHLSTVLRARPEQAVQLFNGDGKNYFGKLLATGKKTLVSIGEATDATIESGMDITLVQAIARGDKMDSIVQKTTELGVNCIQPIYTKHSIATLEKAREERKLTHWQSIMIGACEQSGRATLVNIRPITSLEDYLSNQNTPTVDEHRWILSPTSQPTSSPLEELKKATIMIGPESGFDTDEIDAASQLQFVAKQLGPRVLRTETAGPAAIAILQALYGDMY